MHHWSDWRQGVRRAAARGARARRAVHVRPGVHRAATGSCATTCRRSRSLDEGRFPPLATVAEALGDAEVHARPDRRRLQRRLPVRLLEAARSRISTRPSARTCRTVRGPAGRGRPSPPWRASSATSPTAPGPSATPSCSRRGARLRLPPARRVLSAAGYGLLHGSAGGRGRRARRPDGLLGRRARRPRRDVELAKAYGLADRGHAIANTIDTQFAIASGTKGLTALTVVSLIAGRLARARRPRRVRCSATTSR